jgi:hypothetical protein
MKIRNKILLAVLALFILIQFIRPEKNISSKESKNDIFLKYPASDSVKSLVHTSCYDCHSNNTKYPWYTEIQPLGLWMNHHVEEGKAELNFAEFATYPAKKADHKLDEAIEEINEGEMPISGYTFIHHDAKLSDEQRQAIVVWMKTIRKQIIL